MQRACQAFSVYLVCIYRGRYFTMEERPDVHCAELPRAYSDAPWGDTTFDASRPISVHLDVRSRAHPKLELRSLSLSIICMSDHLWRISVVFLGLVGGTPKRKHGDLIYIEITINSGSLAIGLYCHRRGIPWLILRSRFLVERERKRDRAIER